MNIEVSNNFKKWQQSNYQLLLFLIVYIVLLFFSNRFNNIKGVVGGYIIAANQWQLPWFRYWFSKFRVLYLRFCSNLFSKKHKIDRSHLKLQN
jgi:hypothetical protein